MRVKIVLPVSVEQRHGITEGRVFKAVNPPDGFEGDNRVWVMGDAGEKVRLHFREWEEV